MVYRILSYVVALACDYLCEVCARNKIFKKAFSLRILMVHIYRIGYKIYIYVYV